MDIRDQLTRPIYISVAMPPMLATALGYIDEGQFVAFYYQPEGYLHFNDGLQAGTANKEIFAHFTRHPEVYQYLQSYQFGGVGVQAEHALVLDTENEQLWVISIAAMRELLMKQWPAFYEPSESVWVTTIEEMDAIGAAIQEKLDRAAPAIYTAGVALIRWMQEHYPGYPEDDHGSLVPVL